MKKLAIFILALVGGLALVAAAVMFFCGIIFADTISLWYLLLEPAGVVCIVLCVFFLKAADKLGGY